MANCYLYYNGRHHLMGVYKSTKRGVNLLYKDMMVDEKK